MPSSPRLPRELFAHILQYVPLPYLCQWREVNSAFFQFYMQARYGSVHLKPFDKGEETLQMCRRLRDPGIGRLVHSVDLTVLWYYIESVEEPFIKELETTAACVTAAKNIRFIIHRGGYLYDDEKRRFVLEAVHRFLRAFTNASKDTLRNLTLSISWEWMRDFISIVRADHHLTDLTICTLPEDLEDRVVNDLCVAINPFLGQYAPTLERLTLKFTGTDGDYDSLYKPLSALVLPRLKDFSLAVPFDGRILSDNAAGLVRFLLQHAPQLEGLVLTPLVINEREPVNSTYWELLSAVAHNFTRLRRLGLGLGLADENSFELGDDNTLTLRHLAPFLVSARDTLVDLHLTGMYLSQGELDCVLGELDRTLRGNAQQVQRLAILVRTLTPSTVDLLAARLPNLEFLSLKIVSISTDGEDPGNSLPKVASPVFRRAQRLPLGTTAESDADSDDWDWGDRPSRFTQSFIDAMRKRDYKCWKLTQLLVDEEGPGWCGTGYEWLSHSVYGAIKKAAPRMRGD